MTGKTERGEALAISGRLMAALMSFPIAAGGAGADLRSAAGKFVGNFSELIVNRDHRPRIVCLL